MLAAVMAGAFGAIPAHASDGSDVHSFFAREKAKAAAASSLPQEAKAPTGVSIDKASDAGSKSSADVTTAENTKVKKGIRKRFARQKPANIIPVPRELAKSEDSKAVRSSSPRSRRALGYHSPSRERYRTLIARHAATNGIPFALGDAVVRVESRYQPHVSNRGALGLMQIKHQTARGLGYKGSAKGLLDPETNIKYGMKYLGQAYRMANGDTCGTVMRYQSGHYAKRINRANMAYCSKVRTIIASLGTELAAAETPAETGKTRVE